MASRTLRRMMDNVGGSTTFIGEGTRFVGQLKGDGHFVICGEVEGDCDLSGAITLAINGKWTGKISAHDVVIAGSLNGEVKATGRLELAHTAKVNGSISGSSIAVAEGAIIDGDMKVSSGTDPSSFSEKRNADESD